MCTRSFRVAAARQTRQPSPQADDSFDSSSHRLWPPSGVTYFSSNALHHFARCRMKRHLLHCAMAVFTCNTVCGRLALISHDPTASRYDSRADRAEER